MVVIVVLKVLTLQKIVDAADFAMKTNLTNPLFSINNNNSERYQEP